ncbi:hypothetical protein AOLI_G00308450 [Acnodon oligacanthus]
MRQHQLLYLRDRSALANHILDGSPAERCRVPLSEIEKAFREKWSGHMPYKGLGHFMVPDTSENEHFSRPITSREVRDTLCSIEGNTATGPDRIGKRALLDWDPSGQKIERILNTWWFTGVIPRCLKRCHTVLLPKCKEEALLADIHIADIPHYHRFRPPKALLKDSGDKAHRSLPTTRTSEGLHPCPRMCRERGSTKRHILDVLRLRGVDDHVLGVIREMYTDVTTRVENGRGSATPDISIQVGVKQGDPMSPLLFNLALDPLIRTLNELGKGYHLLGRMLVTLAFADDLALISETWDGMAYNLRILDGFCELTGLRVQPSKCYGFLLKPLAGKSYSLNDCQPWTVGGSPLNMIGPDESERYLGIRVNPKKGIMTPELQNQYEDWVERISRTPLRPHKKVEILRGYTIPPLIYWADHGELGVNAPRALDGTTRKAVKKWLHLPLCTTDGLLFARCKDGGLGLQKLERMVPSIQVRRLHRLANSSDELVRALICEDPHTVTKFQNLWLRAGGSKDSLPPLGTVRAEQGPASQAGPLPMTHRERVYPCDWRNEEFLRWGGQPIQGVGILGFKAVQESRIARHNGVCVLLANAACVAGWIVHRERSFRLPSGRSIRPDLVLAKGRTALVVGVAICYERAPDTLSVACSRKVERYNKYGRLIGAATEVEMVKFFGFPVGARGLWHPGNYELLSEVGLSQQSAFRLAACLYRAALVGSVKVLRDFYSVSSWLALRGVRP